MSEASLVDSVSLQEKVDMINNYRILRTIGQGTYGKVKLGKDERTGEKVAIKVLEKANIKSERQVARIQREIRFLKLLNHPNIVKVHDVIETPDAIYIVMECIAGGELFDYIVANKRVKEREARNFFRQVISALEYCHKNAVIHRDLKPENLLLDAKKNIKIIDFGFANTYKANQLLETYCGSPFYASPEMIIGKKYEGPEVDIWSLGVILFALLCGYLPFDDENMKELYRKISTATFTIPDYVPADCKYLISRMIVADPHKRASLDEIKHHPWVAIGYDGPPDSYLPPRVMLPYEDLDAMILSSLHSFGFKDDEIKDYFNNNEVSDEKRKRNPVVATYFLLKELKIRQQENQANVAKSLPDTASISTITDKTSLYSIREDVTSLTPVYENADPRVSTSATVINTNPTSPTPSSPRSTTPTQEESSSESVKNSATRKGSGDASDQLSKSQNQGKKGKSDKAEKSEKKEKIEKSEESSKREKKPQIVSLRTGGNTPQRVQSPGNRTVASPFNPQEKEGSSSPKTSRPTSPDRVGSVTYTSQRNSITGRASVSSKGEDDKKGIQVMIRPTDSWRTGPVLSRRSQLRTVSGWFMSVSHTSDKDPKAIVIDVTTCLTELAHAGVRFERDQLSPYIVVVEVEADKFNEQIEDQPEPNNPLEERDEVHSFGQLSLSEVGSIASSRSSNSLDRALSPRLALQKLSTLADASARHGVVTFQIEVCKLPKQALHGLHFKRLTGKVWTYSKICGKLMPLLKIK